MLLLWTAGWPLCCWTRWIIGLINHHCCILCTRHSSTPAQNTLWRSTVYLWAPGTSMSPPSIAPLSIMPISVLLGLTEPQHLVPPCHTAWREHPATSTVACFLSPLWSFCSRQCMPSQFPWSLTRTSSLLKPPAESWAAPTASYLNSLPTAVKWQWWKWALKRSVLYYCSFSLPSPCWCCPGWLGSWWVWLSWVLKGPTLGYCYCRSSLCCYYPDGLPCGFPNGHPVPQDCVCV